MSEDAAALAALVEVDRWIDRLAGQRDHLPEQAELTALESELRERAREIEVARAEVAPTRVAYEEALTEAERLATRERDLRERLARSTAGAREIEAVAREAEQVAERRQGADERALALLEELEVGDARVAELRLVAQPALTRRGELVETVAALRASLEDEITAQRTERDLRVVGVAPDLLARYEVRRTRAGVSGAAHVVDGRCDGCRIALAPLDLDRWRASRDSDWIDCPSCGRMLLA